MEFVEKMLNSWVENWNQLLVPVNILLVCAMAHSIYDKFQKVIVMLNHLV